MHYSKGRAIWDEESIGVLRESYLAKKTAQEIADILRDRFDFDISPKAVYNALGRFCEGERTASDKSAKEKAEANRRRAGELIAAGKTVAETADIMGVSIFSIYEWVPSSFRPKTPLSEFNEWLSRFEPLPVQEDPIVDGGKLIFDLSGEDCRWPIGKDADGAFRFCGCQYHRESGSKARPYCEAHAKLDHREAPQEATERQVHNGLRVTSKSLARKWTIFAFADRTAGIEDDVGNRPVEQKMAA